jgi:hypothetical protein
MNDIELIEEVAEEHPGDRLQESVRHALHLVGPAEGGAERLWLDEPRVSGPATRER